MTFKEHIKAIERVDKVLYPLWHKTKIDTLLAFLQKSKPLQCPRMKPKV